MKFLNVKTDFDLFPGLVRIISQYKLREKKRLTGYNGDLY